MVLTISSGYDPLYLTRAVATGRENYYLSAVAEHGEPPGIWTGRGCPQLGLAVGSEVDNKVMERLYGAFIDPRDPERKTVLGRAPSGFAGNKDKVAALIAGLLAAEPEATAERRHQIIMQAMKDQRAAVYFFDATFSVPKSVSLLHASLQVRADQSRQAGRAEEAVEWSARAQVAWDAILAGNSAMLEYLQREAGYSRAGYHSKNSGRFVDAHDWVIASFAQHTSRDNDPQLHVHNAILNRVLREDPLSARPGMRQAWRTIDGTALYTAKPAAAAIAERTMNEHLASRLGTEMVARPDGNGWEVAGVTEAVRDQFSSRRRAILPAVRGLIAEYQRRYGKAPNARAVWSMAQFVTLDSRQAKAHSAPSRETLLARWEAQSRRAETEALSAIPDAALGRLPAGTAPGDHGPGAPLAGLTPDGIRQVLAAAVADAQQHKATFTRYELTRMISRHLPAFLGGLSGEQVTALLEDLTDQALAPGGPCDVLQLTAPEMVPVPQSYRRPDGLSLWRRHGAEVYTTRALLDLETRLVRAAAQLGAPGIEPCHAATELGADRDQIEARLWRDQAHPGAAGPEDSALAAQSGTGEAALSSAGLTDDQAQAAYGILTSRRAIDILVGPAGTGKTRTIARIAEIWRQAGGGRVIGLTVSTNAAHTLAAEGLAESYNLARFLGRTPDGSRSSYHLPVRPGDLLVIDEASMVSTADLAAVEAIATRYGAKILLVGDTEQLSAVDTGGAMRLLVTEHGYYQLVTVQRFDQDWERQASLRLRAGDTGVLAEYDQRGRILEGTREQMADAACRRWLADHLSGKTSLLLAATSSQAADLARRARDELIALGRVSATDVAELYDGNEAGTGDLIVARQNTRITAGEPGRRLANRDILRIDAWSERGEERIALVRRITGHDPGTGLALWSKPFGLPETYIGEHAELAYAANIHVVEGRTVDTAHTVADDAIGREALYVSMSRGRGRNTAYVIIERAHAADVSPQLRPAPEIEDPGIDGKEGSQTNRLAVLAAILEREQAERTATETMRDELDKAASLATLAPIWAEVTRAHVTRNYDATLRSLLTADDWHRYENDPERGTLARLLRAVELAGHDPARLLCSVTTVRDFGGARSIAAVLHGRVQRAVGNPDSLGAGGYADRTPAISDLAAARFAGELAAAIDDRVSLLGIRVAADRPAWAVGYLGEVPADQVGRADWMQRAGQVAAYREERGYTHETEPIGPAPDRGSPELRASWNAAWTALHQPDREREIAAASDGELWSWRAAYGREIAWAPPYVAAELREAHIAEDTYRADAIHASHRADAAADEMERGQACREAEQAGVLAQEVGAYREALAEVDQARRRWHAATEPARQRAISANAELRRRHPDTEMPTLDPGHQDYAHERSAVADEHSPDRQMPDRDAGPDIGGTAAASDARQIGPNEDCLGVLHRTQEDIEAALRAARQAEAILAARESSTIRKAAVEDTDLMHRRQAAAERDATVRRNAVRQDPAPSHRARELERDEQELEAGM